MTPHYYVCRFTVADAIIKHATLESAATKLERLAAQHPNETFAILKCIGITRAVTPQTFWLDGVIPPQNFDRPRGRPGVAFNG
jgi:hypothetical protein